MPDATWPDNRILVKLRPTGSLRAAESRANLRPLLDTPASAPAAAFGAAGESRWYLADLPDGGGSPWDLAHARVADQLGVDEGDVEIAEPDLVHNVYFDPTLPEPGALAAVGETCEAKAQDGSNGKAVGAVNGWHLGDDFSQLARARAGVEFTGTRTRIAHLDTGYFGAHVTVPRHLRHDLEHSFVDGDRRPGSAEDPDNKRLVLDNSGHGTGTISILAGGLSAGLGMDMGGAPEADVVPLRIADSVVLLRTSSFAQALNYAVDVQCDVLSMSMGGLPSAAWREAVDRAYLAGLCMVTAAGNNFGGAPTRNVVYPARYGRVICACGAMANGQPYAGLEHHDMEGNYGPGKVMQHALAAYSPNIPWAVFGCPGVVRWNGGGTSAATPQIAAAAALYFEKHKQVLPRSWQRVEAVRKALFDTAAKGGDSGKLGNGILRAAAALAVAPDLSRPQTKADSDSLAFLRVITGLGIAEPTARERMFNLEVMQRLLLNPRLAAVVPDPEVAALDPDTLKRFMAAVIEDDGASLALRRHFADRYPAAAGGPVPQGVTAPRVVPDTAPVCDAPPELTPPPYRRLRVYATDPSLSTRLDTASTNEVSLPVRWERLDGVGPAGEYLLVDDVDDRGTRYAPVDLNDPRLLAQEGWAPAEGNPQFHQQMVYAVAMKTIEHFERALGRPVLWRPRPNPQDPEDDRTFMRQLVVRPHALHQANAFYSPQQGALLFGYFEARADDPGDHMPGSRVYACLSHDIVAHETTHALLDGMHRRYNEPTNPDVLAFHEGFADIVALMQHFAIPQVLTREIARARGDLEAESMLGSLAVQFGAASGGHGALREAIGRMENGVWKRLVPNPADLAGRQTAHGRGAVLVAAVFDAFIAIYKSRTADLLRIYTGGTGVLPGGAIHPDLVQRLADEAAKAARHVLTMCIRALDYLPPVDVTFFEYLRALITADFDLVGDDRYGYRVAFVEAFRRRGIYPVDLDDPAQDTPRTLSVDTLRWQGLDMGIPADVGAHYLAIAERLRTYAGGCLYETSREKLFEGALKERGELKGALAQAFAALPDFAAHLGLDPALDFEVHQLRSAIRTSPEGRTEPQVVVALTQCRTVPADADKGVPEHSIRGGSTLVVDLTVPEVRYRIVKKIGSERRAARTADFLRFCNSDPLRRLFLTPDRGEPFAALHALSDTVR